MNELLEWMKVVLPVAGTVLLGLGSGVGGACAMLLIQRPRATADIKKTEADVDALQVKTVVELWDHLSALQAQITSMRTDLARMAIENATLRADNASLTAKNAALEAKVASQDGEIAELRRRITDYEGRFTQAGRAMVEGGTTPP